MTDRLRTVLRRVTPPFIVAILLVAFSAWRARRFSDEILRDEVAPPPHYSTRFVLYAEKHIQGADGLGLKPGWVVSYAPATKLYGTAFFVGLLGKMLARGTPEMVAEQRREHDNAVSHFCSQMHQFDTNIVLGMSRSKVLAVLGSPMHSDTNYGPAGNWVRDDFVFEPRVLLFYDFITNGFSILYSNDAVIQKHPITGTAK